MHMNDSGASIGDANRLVTTVVRFRAPHGVVRTNGREVFEHATPLCRSIPGLLRKYYLCEGQLGGGLYLWEDRQAAERFHTAEWCETLAREFGVLAEVLFIERTAQET